MMKNKYLVPFFFILFNSCYNNTAIDHEFQVIGNAEFNVGFNYNEYHSGIFNYDNKQGIYFFDPVSANCIKTFSLEGQMLDSIPLRNVNNIIYENYYRDRLGQVVLFSRDTILIMTSMSGSIFYINSKGEIIKQIDNLKEYMHNDYEYELEFLPSFYSNSTDSQNKLLFRPWFDPYDVSVKNNLTNKPLSQEICLTSQLEHENVPYLIKVSFMSNDSMTITKEPMILNRKLYGDENGEFRGAMPDICNFFKYVGNDVFLLNAHSDCLYKLNGETLFLTDEIKIESQKTDIGIEPLMLNPNDPDSIFYANLAQNDKEKLITGMLENIFFNDKTEEYYIIVTHTLENAEKCHSYGYYGAYRPFSIIVYDKDFSNSKEYSFEANLYNCKVSFLTDKGFMILKKNDNKNNYEKQVFDIISFD